MKFLVYISKIIIILSIFTSIDAKLSNKRNQEEKKQKKRKLQVARSSSGSTFSKSSLLVNSRSNNARGMSSALSLQFKKTRKDKNPAQNWKLAAGPHYDGRRPIKRGPMGIPGTPKGFVKGPKPYGYFRGGFPIWLKSYSVIMDDVEECPARHNDLKFTQKSNGLCLLVCDKKHCIQTRDYCCYYVEQKKFMVFKK